MKVSTENRIDTLVFILGMVVVSLGIGYAGYMAGKSAGLW